MQNDFRMCAANLISFISAVTEILHIQSENVCIFSMLVLNFFRGKFKTEVQDEGEGIFKTKRLKKE